TYARWKEGRSEGEVDLVLVDDKKFKPVWGVEIKWSNRFFDIPQDLTSLTKFCKANSFEKALVTTIDKQGIKVVSEINFTFVPSSVYAYNIGEVTLRMKNG